MTAYTQVHESLLFNHVTIIVHGHEFNSIQVYKGTFISHEDLDDKYGITINVHAKFRIDDKLDLLVGDAMDATVHLYEHGGARHSLGPCAMIFHDLDSELREVSLSFVAAVPIPDIVKKINATKSDKEIKEAISRNSSAS